MKRLSIILVFLTTTTITLAQKSESVKEAANIDLLFIAKVILSAIIVFVGISALRAYLRHEE